MYPLREATEAIKSRWRVSVGRDGKAVPGLFLHNRVWGNIRAAKWLKLETYTSVSVGIHVHYGFVHESLAFLSTTEQAHTA